MDSSDFLDLSAEPAAIRRLSPEQKERLTDILDRYLSALGRGTPPAREDLLRRHPDLADSLIAYLDSLDDLHGAAAGFAGSSRRIEAEADPPEPDESRLGDFRLLREIGRGGMGVVYDARQVSLDRRVALKVLPFAAVLDSKQITRFRNEAQAAAQVNHPGIVPVFAVGVDRGVHYYAMQFIDGQPLDRAIAELRRTSGLSPTAAAEGESDPPSEHAADDAEASSPSTLRSFATAHSSNRPEYFRTVAGLGIQAAEALDAAHEYGIIHRDVKPSNLLLDAEGKLWVTDFGLARCQADATLTRTGDVVGTMRYMSPEQAAGRSALVDQRTDIYSLGVTLYELLALQPAFRDEDGPALLRRIDEEDPKRLRQLQPKVPADLETVIHKAMAKQREDRYTTGGELADDLRRVLENKPIVARRPTPLDRLGKWARRHRRIVAAAAAVAVCALVGLAVSTVLVMREKAKAEENYARAERHFHVAQQTVHRFGSQLAERLAEVPGAVKVRRELLQETLDYYRGFVEEAGDDPMLAADLALTYGKIGTLAGEIGSIDEAIEAYQQSRRLLEQLAAENPADAETRCRLADCLNNLGLALSRRGRTEDARQAHLEAIRLQEELARRQADGGRYMADLARYYNSLGLLDGRTGEFGKAESSFGEARRHQQQLLEADPNNPDHLAALAATLNNLGSLYLAEQPNRALQLYQKALSCRSQVIAARPDDAETRSALALTYNNLGFVQSQLSLLPEAAESYQKAIAIQRRLVEAAPMHNLFRRDLAVSLNNLGLAVSRLRKPQQAEQCYREALELQEFLVAQNPNDVEMASSLGGIYNNLGALLEGVERSEAAAESYRRAVEHQSAAFEHAPQITRYRLFLSKHYYNYGRVLRRCGHPEEAARAALARRSLWADDPKHLLAVAEELALASRALEGASRPGLSAEECAEAALATLRQAVSAGLEPTSELYHTEAFASLRTRPGFAELMDN